MEKMFTHSSCRKNNMEKRERDTHAHRGTHRVFSCKGLEVTGGVGTVTTAGEKSRRRALKIKKIKMRGKCRDGLESQHFYQRLCASTCWYLRMPFYQVHICSHCNSIFFRCPSLTVYCSLIPLYIQQYVAFLCLSVCLSLSLSWSVY